MNKENNWRERFKETAKGLNTGELMILISFFEVVLKEEKLKWEEEHIKKVLKGERRRVLIMIEENMKNNLLEKIEEKIRTAWVKEKNLKVAEGIDKCYRIYEEIIKKQ